MNEMMDVEELARYLRRDVREVGKMISRGHLPGQKVGGEWRFSRSEINQWLQGQLLSYSDDQLAAFETSPGTAATEEDLLLAEFLAEASAAVPLQATTRSSVLQELIKLAEMSWHVYDPETLLASIRSREEIGSTSLPGGVAIPHLHRPLPAALGDTVIAYGRTLSAIPFGGPKGAMTDLFFLVCSREDQTHLRILARLSRLFLRPGFLDELREIDNGPESHAFILQAERELMELE